MAVTEREQQMLDLSDQGLTHHRPSPAGSAVPSTSSQFV